MFKFRFDQYLALFIVMLLLLVTAYQAQPRSATQPPDVELVEMADLPILPDSMPASDSANFTATLSAQAVLAVDLDSAAILLEKNKNQKLAPASTTKIMTALVAADLFDLDQVITVPEKLIVEGHSIGFQAGQKFLVQDLLKALLINSGNDAAVILAENHPQGRAAFIEQMNQKAQELGLSQTSFINSSGLDAAAHYSTAFELSIMARELIKNDFYRQLVRTKQDLITDLEGQAQYYLYNTNQQLEIEEGVIGIKTGTTDLAGQALITLINRQDSGQKRSILIILLGSQDRYLDSKEVIEWIFSHYQWQEISVR